MMKKILTILIAGLMMFSMVACDLGETVDTNSDNPGTSQNGANNNNSNIKISTATIDGYDLPDVALAYVGMFHKAYNDLYNDGEITFYVKSKDADEDAFDALVNYYAANGGTLDEANSTSTTKCFDFEWGRIEAAHFGVDEEISAYIILPEYPIADSQNGENTSNDDENNENQGGEDEKISVYGDGTIVICDYYTAYHRDGYGVLSIKLCYSNGDIVEFGEEHDILQGMGVSAAEWGFSTTDSVCTLTVAGWSSNQYAEVSEIEIRFEGITEDEFVRGLKDLTDITYTPVEGKEIRTSNGEVIEGFTLNDF